MAIRKAVANPDRLAFCEPSVFSGFAALACAEFGIMLLLLSFQPLLIMLTVAVASIVGPAVQAREPDLRYVLGVRRKVGGFGRHGVYEP